MIVTKKPAGPSHKDKPTSKLSQHKYVTKPEELHPTTHNYNVNGAISKISKAVK